MHKIAFLLLAGILCGCGPSANQQVRQNFRLAVAALQVCTKGSTYAEFREKRLALETCYTANQKVLAADASNIESLIALAGATDQMWDWQNQFHSVSLWSGGDAWNAMLLITPSVAMKANFSSEQRDKDPDFNAHNYVERGLLLISTKCQALLN